MDRNGSMENIHISFCHILTDTALTNVLNAIVFFIEKLKALAKWLVFFYASLKSYNISRIWVTVSKTGIHLVFLKSLSEVRSRYDIAASYQTLKQTVSGVAIVSTVYLRYILLDTE